MLVGTRQVSAKIITTTITQFQSKINWFKNWGRIMYCRFETWNRASRAYHFPSYCWLRVWSEGFVFTRLWGILPSPTSLKSGKVPRFIYLECIYHVKPIELLNFAQFGWLALPSHGIHSDMLVMAMQMVRVYTRVKHPLPKGFVL